MLLVLDGEAELVAGVCQLVHAGPPPIDLDLGGHFLSCHTYGDLAEGRGWPG